MSKAREKNAQAHLQTTTDVRTLVIDGHEVHLTHLTKPYWPEEGFSKGDLLAYYEAVNRWILPHLKGRPLSLHRQPNGIHDKGFFQKDIGDDAPDWVRTQTIDAPSAHRTIKYLICDDEATLLYLVNLGCIEIHPWNSRVGKLDRPDHLVIDLDPSEGNNFDQVVEAALAVKDVLDRIGATGCCKTSGASGLHVYVPLRAKYNYDEVAPFAGSIAKAVNDLLPRTTTLERSLSKRAGRIYLDHQQNHRGQTIAAPYSVRPMPGATVSTPLRWNEVKIGMDRSRFTLRTIPARVERLGDLFWDVLGKGIDLKTCRRKLGE